MSTDDAIEDEHSEELVVEHDDDSRAWFVDAGTFGPAGGGVVEVVPGVSLMADIARPDRFCRLEIDADDRTVAPEPAVLDAVARLAGSDVAQVLSRTPLEPTRLERHRDSAVTGRGRNVLPNRATRAAALAGLAASEPDEPLWQLEHAYVASVSGWHYLAREATQDLTSLAERLLDAASAAAPTVQLPKQDQRKAEELIAWLVRELEAIDAPLARQIATMGLGLLGRVPSETTPERGEQLDWRRAPGTADLEVTLDGDDDRQWVCAFDGSELVAVAPVVVVGTERQAQLYVPPAVEAGRLRVVATDDPAEVAHSPALLAFIASTSVGRRAAQLERIGRFSEAASAWDDCAERWTAEADDVRARLARSYAYAARVRAGEQPRRSRDVDSSEIERPVPQPYLVDILVRSRR